MTSSTVSWGLCALYVQILSKLLPILLCMPPCANPLSSTWPNFATSAFSQPSPVNYTFFTCLYTNNLQPKVRTYNKSDWAPTLTSLSWLTCSRSSPIQMANFALCEERIWIPSASNVKPWNIPASLEDSPCCLKYFLGVHVKFQAAANNASVAPINSQETAPANSTKGTSGLEYLPCAIGRAHQLALCSSFQPLETADFFAHQKSLPSGSENPQRCLQLAQGNPDFFLASLIQIWQFCFTKPSAFKRPQVTKWRNEIPKLVSSFVHKKLDPNYSSFQTLTKTHTFFFKKIAIVPLVLCFLLPNECWEKTLVKETSVLCLHLCSTQTCLNLSNCFPSHARNACSGGANRQYVCIWEGNMPAVRRGTWLSGSPHFPRYVNPGLINTHAVE